ncbi:hypothetical protein Ddc_24634 [Ditylenchus destructor]|nr:hypothetical protein Ddc_24634 [Ditylenchus destructor]
MRIPQRPCANSGGVDRFSVAVAHTLRDARRQMAMQPPSLVLLDLQLPDGNGMDLFGDQQPGLLHRGPAPRRHGLSGQARGHRAAGDILSRFLIPTAGLPERGTSTVTGAAFDQITPQDRQAPATARRKGAWPAVGRLGPHAAAVPAEGKRVAGTSVTVFRRAKAARQGSRGTDLHELGPAAHPGPSGGGQLRCHFSAPDRKRKSSAMKRAASPVPIASTKAISSARTGARCSWTKSLKCRSTCR